MINRLRTMISGLNSSKETVAAAAPHHESKLTTSRLATRVLLVAAMGGGTVGATSSLGACSGPDFTIGEADSGVDPADAGSDTVNSETAIDASADSASEAESGDPCAPADGFKVTIKGLPGNKYDWVLFDEKGNAVKDSLLDGIDESSDNVVTGVKYNYVLMHQSKSSTGSSSLAEYAAENIISLPVECVDESVKKAPITTFTTMPYTDFKLMHDTCSGCTPISSSASKPMFHYEYKAANPSYKSTLYHITFTKP